MRWISVSLLLFPLMACGSRDERPGDPGPGEGCDDPLALSLSDDSCPRPGVLPDACGEGFVHDGGYGCEPVLPDETCPPGTMALPGETSCRPVMPCAEGKWGDIPRDATTQHVDGSFAGPSDGSEAQPWTTINEAVAAAAPGAVVAIAEGVYTESVSVGLEPVQIRGVCPDRVTVEGPTTSATNCPPSAFCFEGSGADGSVVSGLSATGGGVGIFLSGTQDLALESLRVSGNALRGINAQDTAGPTSVTIRRSLIEGNFDVGVYTGGASVSIESSVVRDTQPQAGQLGIGVMLNVACVDTPAGQECNPRARSEGTVTGSVIERNGEAGITAIGSDLTVEDSIVRDTLPRADGEAGHGVSLWPSCDPSSSNCDGTQTVGTIRRSVLSANHAGAVFATGSDVTIEDAVLRDSLPKPIDQTKGVGLILQSVCELQGVAVICATGAPTKGTLRNTLVAGNHDVGIFASGSELTIEGVAVTDTQPRALDGVNGRGLNVQGSCFPGELGPICNAETPASASIRESIVSDSHGIGLFVGGSSVNVTRSVIRRTQAHASDGLVGDGVVYESVGGLATGQLEEVIVDNSARAGVGVFGAILTLASTTIRCAPFALTGEEYAGQPFELIDEGENWCGCDGTSEACKVVSVDLEPPGL